MSIMWFSSGTELSLDFCSRQSMLHPIQLQMNIELRQIKTCLFYSVPYKPSLCSHPRNFLQCSKMMAALVSQVLLLSNILSTRVLNLEISLLSIVVEQRTPSEWMKRNIKSAIFQIEAYVFCNLVAQFSLHYIHDSMVVHRDIETSSTNKKHAWHKSLLKMIYLTLAGNEATRLDASSWAKSWISLQESGLNNWKAVVLQ